MRTKPTGIIFQLSKLTIYQIPLNTRFKKKKKITDSRSQGQDSKQGAHVWHVENMLLNPLHCRLKPTTQPNKCLLQLLEFLQKQSHMGDEPLGMIQECEIVLWAQNRKACLETPKQGSLGTKLRNKVDVLFLFLLRGTKEWSWQSACLGSSQPGFNH